ncbi:MAG: hypothetical protein KGI06_05895 [Candidatus Micrarchaeota archaeon]|nr:hypothetical protein [Candidatus Micrarchaeota archaeon]
MEWSGKNIVIILIVAFSVLTAFVHYDYFSSLKGGSGSTVSYTTTAFPAFNNTPNRQVIVDLITWTSQNGYSSIKWNYITELDVFHVWIGQNETLSYDGNLSGPNIAQIISSEHNRNIKVLLSVGGDGENPSIINKSLSNSTLRGILVNNIVTVVSAQGYDGVKIDFEGYYNQSDFTAFIKQLSTAMRAKDSSYIITMNIANWYASDFNLTALAPYVNNFEVQFNPSLLELQNYANEVGGRSKISAGYDLTNPSNFTQLKQSLANDRAAGYGIFFYNAAKMNSTVWTALNNVESQTWK